MDTIFWILFLLNIVANLSFSIPDQPTVNTDCGPVTGTLADSAYVFKGIPYALPPLRKRRWKPPVPLSKMAKTCWSGMFNATSFGHTCMQRNPHNDSQIIGSEDCLFLNVWTPTINPNAKLPVMVWIHGGSLQVYNGNWPTYCPTGKLAIDTNAVYVSMNYRLHAFGFMALDILSQNSPTNTSGNFGFMDQQSAMRWVQKNIKNFGGDPNLVTVFGQSSGGTSIIGLLASPLSKGLFHRAWMMSASPVYNKTLHDASNDNKIFLKNTGCSDINCLYNFPAEDVVRAVPWNVYPYWRMSGQSDLPMKGHFYGAICIVDGYVVPEPPFDMWKNGKGIDVPLMIAAFGPDDQSSLNLVQIQNGDVKRLDVMMPYWPWFDPYWPRIDARFEFISTGTMAQEVDIGGSHHDMNEWTWDKYQTIVKNYLDTFPGNISAQALGLYPAGIIAPPFQYTTMTSDLRVICPNEIMTDVLANSFSSPVYQYVANARPSHPVRVVGIPFEAKYACHMWDSIAFFGSIGDYYTPEDTDLKFQQIIQKEIINFAKTGQPLSVSWKTSSRGFEIISTNLTFTNSYHSNMCSFWNKYNFFSYGWIN